MGEKGGGGGGGGSSWCDVLQNHPNIFVQAPVVQRADNFIHWIGRCVETLPEALFGVHLHCWIVTYPLDKVIRPLNNWGQDCTFLFLVSCIFNLMLLHQNNNNYIINSTFKHCIKSPDEPYGISTI